MERCVWVDMMMMSLDWHRRKRSSNDELKTRSCDACTFRSFKRRSNFVLTQADSQDAHQLQPVLLLDFVKVNVLPYILRLVHIFEIL